MEHQLLDVKEVNQLLNIGRATLYRLMDAGHTPLPVKVGTRAVRWCEDEIMDWIQAGCPPRNRWKNRNNVI